MDRFSTLKSLSSILESSKQDIVGGWGHSRNTSEIVAKHDITVDIFIKELGEEFFDCVIAFYKWGAHVTSCDGFNRLVTFINKNNIIYHELVLLQDALKNSLVDTLYKHGLLSKVVNDEINELFADMFKEVADHLLSKAFSFSDVYEKEKQKNIRLLNEYKKAVDESNIVSKTNTKGVITYVNKQFCKISGYSEEELLGQPHNIVRHPEMPKDAFRDMWDTIKAKRTWRG
ncbi:MAG: PAS domain S-box protein, partial [Campylobacterales bacterium]|nr:PAS domain S-box protein [Campylobacterales bacterium]